MLYNQANFWLYKAMQEYHLEETTEEAIIKRQHAARAQKPEAQERLLGSLFNRLSGRETSGQEPCDPAPEMIRTKTASRRAL